MWDPPRIYRGVALVAVGALLVTGVSSLLYGEWVVAQPNPWGQLVGSIAVQGWESDANVVYDPASHELYVDSGNLGGYPSVDQGQNVWIVNASAGRVVGSVTAGSQPLGMTVDLSSGNLFVEDEGPNTVWGGYNVTELNGSTHTLIRSTPLDYLPVSLAYDPVSGWVYVGGLGQPTLANLTALDPSTGAIVAQTSGQTDGVAVDPTTGSVVFASPSGPSVMVVDASTLRSERNISTGIEVVGAAAPSMIYDPETGDMLVTGALADNGQASAFSAFNATTGSVVASDVPLPGRQGASASVAYDAQDGRFYIVGSDCGESSYSDCLVVVDARTYSVLGILPLGDASFSAAAIAFDPTDGLLYLDDPNQNTLWVVSPQAAASPLLTSLPYATELLLGTALGGLLVAVGARELWLGRKGGEHRLPAWVRAEQRRNRTVLERHATWLYLGIIVLCIVLMLVLLAG